ncbi:DUF6443 domain-containing protein, partial [Flavihumibacter sp. CACIAM 22H1]|uniref:DUF6443 domain-containing protein n=1 Tax=Flavihumibacter sp. CACIAM 22H1 TaxID=1812911 RepID=UPI0025BE771B
MKMFITRILRVAFLFGSVLIVPDAKAQQEPVYTNLLLGDSILEGKLISIQDTVFFNPSLKPTILQTNSLYNIVSLRLNEYANPVLPDTFSAEVKIRLIYKNVDELQDSISEKTLKISYSKEQPYKARDYVILQGAYELQVKVLEVTASAGVLDIIRPSLLLENKMIINRDYTMNPITGETMDCAENAIRLVSKDISTIEEYGELKISWTPNPVIESYDVEWTYIDSSSLASGKYEVGGQLNPTLLFRNNATRIRTSADTCMIPLLYDGKGTLFYRVRGVQVSPGGELLSTSWSSDFISEGGLGQHDFLGHERKLNWQSTTSFAEEAKRKSVVQYFDGSLRNRQTITRDNTTDSTIVAETFYDKQGRPVIQVLPAPSLSRLIGYTPGFNVHHINSSEYDKRIYDTLLSASDYCAPFTDSMGVSSGAARYYSDNNPSKEHLYNQFIPNAKGYAFTETQYSQDNTGRINRQGGVGKDFQIGSGHETRYYYANPEQTDLDALFGTEAGDATHYQKNMVRDANGQYSVSYMDMHGRTVATALAGIPPSNLDTLSSYRDSVQTESIVTATNNILSGTTVQATKSLIVTREGTHSFSYTMGADTLTLADCEERNICYDCLYDLTITITDDCNNQLLGGSPIVINKSNFKLFEIDTICGLVHPLDTSFTVSLQPGVYNITKKLSVSEAAIGFYRDSVYLVANTCINYDSLLVEQMAVVRSDMNCAIEPEPVTEYQSYRKDMLFDMYPLIGQYADTATVDELGNPILDRCFSIFNNGFNSYRNPSLVYLDENGAPAKVINREGVLVSPNSLTVEEFIENFQISWAEELLKIHPERAGLELYESFSASHIWEEEFSKTETYAEAKSKGYLNPTGSTAASVTARFPVENVDPLFIDYSIGAVAKFQIENKMFLYTSVNGTAIHLWGLATAMSKCPDYYTADPSCVQEWNQVDNFFSESALCEGELDMAWRAFRSQYSTLKKDWIVAQIKSHPSYIKISEPCVAHFASASDLMAKEGFGSDTSVYRAMASERTAQLFEDNCLAFASTWWRKLQRPCDYYTAADSAVLIGYLVQVCKEGADLDHPYGSSSVRPGSSYRFKDFEAVIQFYNDSTGRTTNIDCNAFLLDRPLPYSHSAPVVNEPLYSKPDDCACEQISTYYNQYQSVYSEYASFSQFLKLKYNTDISQGSLDTLRMLCNDIGLSCKYLPKPVSLPPIFRCTTGEACVPCERIDQVYAGFKSKFPGQIPVYEETDTTQQKVNRVFSSYMNNQLGFSFSHLEYLSFMDSCALDSAGMPGSFSWTDTTAIKLHKLLDDFQYYYSAKSDKFANRGNNGQYLWSAGGLVNNLRPIVDATDRGILNIIDSGRLHAAYRDSSIRWGGAVFNNVRYTKVFNEYALEARVKNPGGGGLSFFVGNKSINDSTVSLDEDYGVSFSLTQDLGYIGYRGTRIYDSAFGKRVSFADWRVIKIQVTIDSFKVYVDSVQVKSYVRDNKSYITHLSTCHFTASEGRTFEMDWMRLYRGNDTLVHEETFNDYPTIKVPDPGFFVPLDCREEFTGFYNSSNGTSFTISQIDSIYSAKFGRIPSYCDSADCALGFSETLKLLTDSALDISGNLQVQVSTTTLEGGYIFGGKANINKPETSSTSRFLLKKNAKGVAVWRKNYTDTLPDFIKIIQTKDGGFLAVNGQGGHSAYYLTKFDKSGQINWSRNMGGVMNTNFKLLETRTGKFVLLGHEDSVYGRPAIRFFHLNKAGVILQQFRYALPKSTYTEGYGLNHMDAVETKDSILLVGSISSFPLQGGVIIDDGVGFKFSIAKKTGQSSQLAEYRGPRDQTAFTEIVPAKNGFNVATYFQNQVTGNPSSPLANYMGVTNIAENGSILGTQKIYFKDSSTAGVHYITSDEDSTLYSAYLIDSSIFIRKHDTLTGWSSVLDMRTIAAAPVASNDSGMFTPFAVVGPGYTFDGIKKKTNGKGLLLDAFSNNQYQGYTYQVLSEKGKLTCGWAPFTPDTGSYSLTVLKLPITRDTIAITGVASIFGNGEDFGIAAEQKCKPIPCEAPRGILLCGRAEALNDPMEFAQEDPCSDSTSIATMLATELFRIKRDSLLGQFESDYLQKCLSAVHLEEFTVSHPVSEYHYTLYYYDLAGNLVKTVPPEGVQPNRNKAWLDEVALKKSLGEYQVPEHRLATVYRYNSLNQVVSQYTPDGGKSSFWYDRLGRLSVSQNAQQALEEKYSYTAYDFIGRITEVGQKPQANQMTNELSRNPGLLNAWVKSTYTNANSDLTLAEQVTSTVYDAPDPTLSLVETVPVNQKTYTLRNRVSYSRTYDFLLADGEGLPRASLFDYSTTYSYDIHGNVDTLLQQYRSGIMGVHGDNRFKVLAYKYDLISGKVNQVHYQPGQLDQLYHRYEYDADNRLTDVYTTDSKILIGDRDLEEHDAHYDYYQHGPLARTILGQQQVQALDYAYTLQGWLKGVNSMGLAPGLDMGADGASSSLVARDAISFQLNYFSGDYAAISDRNPFPGHSAFLPNGEYRPLYNGNISSMGVNIGRLNQPQLYTYKYDQLNRLTRMDTYRGYSTGSNNWTSLTGTEDYKERIRYDGNGNILGYLRQGTTVDGGTLQMDSLSYHYFIDVNGNKRNNRLRVVADGVGSSNYSVDLDDQVSRLANGADSNYVYDAIGNMIQDKTENITNIQWSVYGKILAIEKAAVNPVDITKISYTYDATGNRIGKRIQYQGKPDQYTWYSRDASGNVMAVYEYTGTNLAADTLWLREHHLYGSSRMGIWNRRINMDLPVSAGTSINLLGTSTNGIFERGQKFFELSNHLGNVLATVSDKKVGIDTDSDGIYDYFQAEVVSASDYYPFGMLMPGRQVGMGINIPGGEV